MRLGWGWGKGVRRRTLRNTLLPIAKGQSPDEWLAQWFSDIGRDSGRAKARHSLSDKELSRNSFSIGGGTMGEPKPRHEMEDVMVIGG